MDIYIIFNYRHFSHALSCSYDSHSPQVLSHVALVPHLGRGSLWSGATSGDSNLSISHSSPRFSQIQPHILWELTTVWSNKQHCSWAHSLAFGDSLPIWLRILSNASTWLIACTCRCGIVTHQAQPCVSVGPPPTANCTSPNNKLLVASASCEAPGSWRSTEFLNGGCGAWGQSGTTTDGCLEPTPSPTIIWTSSPLSSESEQQVFQSKRLCNMVTTHHMSIPLHWLSFLLVQWCHPPYCLKFSLISLPCSHLA
jgi:hypothetical protein